MQNVRIALRSLTRVALVAIVAVALQTIALQPARADTLDRIKSANTVVFGFREDARPFSFKDDAGQPAGFTVALCEKVAEALKAELNLPNLATKWTAVSLSDRIAAIKDGQIDVFCGADQETLEARKEV